MQTLQIVQKDPWLKNFEGKITERHKKLFQREKQITSGKSLSDFATGYLYYGLHKLSGKWVLREWAPNATEMFMVGDFSGWKVDERYRFSKMSNGNWELTLSDDALTHGQLYKLFVKWKGGEAYRLPSYGKRMVQDDKTKIFTAQVWNDETYKWKIKKFKRAKEPVFIYEAHVGMSSEQEKVSSFVEFRDTILPRIKKLGYNTIQLMAIQEHPYYGSFGYHVSNFYAVSSRFGTPEELKSLIDTAHENGIAVVMDIVHSHAVKNVDEGLGEFDGTKYQYFHNSWRRNHVAWDSLCFDYGKPEVVHFLLSNCKYWMEEYKFDGFRFDGVTSMIYLDHGLGVDFTNYNMYYDGNQDEDAIIYMALANKLIHELKSDAITIAEDMSGMPGLAAPIENGGYGFDYRLAMGVPDYWIKIIKELPDEKWSVSGIYSEMTSHRADEKTISYSESHDQALVGDKTIIFRLADKEMYYSMGKANQNLVIDRAMSLHKIIRMIVASCSGGGYLNFMGNEFGHPEWIDFPRAGNNWSCKHARRQWSLLDDKKLRFHYLADFDADMVELLKTSGIFKHDFPRLLNADENNQVVFFERGGLYFIFNFNPNQSFTNYDLPAEAGKYKIIFNSDRPEYGGFNRLDESIIYFTTFKGHISSLAANYLTLYIPNRTAMVLKKLPTKSVYDK
jgi:1,4-alpha-glucan branching enzyme